MRRVHVGKLALIAALAVLTNITGFGQTPGTPAFEVASIKPSDPKAPPGVNVRGGPGSSDPGQVSYTNFPLEHFHYNRRGVSQRIASAFEVSFQMAGKEER
jgi:hypothetical protein